MQHNNQTYHLLYNHQGSLRAVVDQEGTLIKELHYNSFGKITLDTNPDFEIELGFAGGLYDKDTKLTRFGYRDYDAHTSKWTAKDPIGFSGGDSNLYGYVLHDPVNFIDPEGLRSLCESLEMLGDKLGNDIPDDIREALEKLFEEGIPKMWQNSPWYAKLPLVHAAGVTGVGAGNGMYMGYHWVARNPMAIQNFMQGATTQTPNLSIPAQRYGYAARKMLDNIIR